MARKHRTETVLIIEDEADIRTFASRVLELEGYRILQAENGDTGLRLVRETQVALVLLDLQLPERNGWAVLAELKSDAALSAIPVIMFTASAAVAQRDRARTLELEGFSIAVAAEEHRENKTPVTDIMGKSDR
jgi:CheY-like chemotaxis protein